MIAQKLTVECAECGICRCNLNDYIGTVCAVFHHFPDTAYLTFDTVKAVNKSGIFFLGALLCLMTALAEFLFVHKFLLLVRLCLLIIIIYPMGVYVKSFFKCGKLRENLLNILQKAIK